jgi:hypothetical protein
MEPIQILEAIKEDIRDKFDGDPLMMRTMNLVITEYKARSERLHKPVVGGPGSDVRSEGEQLGNEGVAKSVCDGLYYCSLEKTRNADGTCAECGLPKRA